MKHLKLFFALFAMLALGVGNAWGAEETVSWTATTNSLGSAISKVNGTATGTIKTGDFVWNYTRTLTSLKSGKTDYVQMSNGYMQCGSSNAINSLKFQTSNIPGTIKSVAVDCASYQGKHNISITVGGTTYLAKTAVPTWSSNKGGVKTGTGTSSGEIIISFTDGTRALYIKSITVVYEETSGSGSGETVVSLPTFTPESGTTFTESLEVTLSAESGCDIYYTTDDTEPTTSSTKYTSSIKLTESKTIKAIANNGTKSSAVATATYTKVDPTGTFTLHTGDLIEGDYVIVSTNALANTVNKERIASLPVTISNNTITDPSVAVIWHIAKSGDYWTLYNENAKKYAASTGVKNKAALLDADEDGKALWSVSGTETYEFINKKNTENSVNANLRYNSGNDENSRWACYSTSIGGALSLYRKAGTKYNVTVSSTTNGSVTAEPTSAEAGTTITLTVTPAGGYVLDALTITDASSNPVTVTDNKFTMPASDVTVSATFKVNEAPDAVLQLIANGEEVANDTHKVGYVATLPTTIENDCAKTFVGWSENENCTAEPEYGPGAKFTITKTEHTLYAVYANVEGGEIYTTDNLFNTTNGSFNSTAGTIAWSLDGVVSILQAKDNASSAVANYVDAPRWYKDHLITITPSANIKEIIVKAQSNDYATALASSTYTNATATASSDIVTITPTNGNEKITIKMGAQARLYTLTVTYASAVTYSNYSTTCSAALANPTFSLAEGKYTEVKSVTISAAEGTIYYTMDGTTPTASSTQYTGAIALNDCGEYTIKAIAISADSQSDVVSATYTIKLPLTNSQAAPYTEAEAIAVYDGGCYDNQDVYVKGTVKTATFNSTYGNYTITLTNGFQFYRFLQAAETKFTEDIIVPGDVLVACGKLSKYQTTYQLAEGCYLVERIPYEGEKTDISNTEATAYTVDKAFELIADVKSDLTKEVYVKGLVAVAPTSNPTADGQMTYSISDNGENTGNVLKVYLGLNLNGEKFTSKEDVKLGDYVVVKGQLYDYNSTYELNKGNQLVQHVKAATITIADITMEVGETKTIAATITPAAAESAISYSIKENTANAISLSGNTITANAVGTATITATIATAAEYMGKTVDFTVTVNAKSTKEKVVILAKYGDQWYAMMAQYVSGKTSHLAALPVTYVGGKLYNVADADKSLIEWERAIVDGKATFKNGSNYLTGKSGKTDLTLATTAYEWTIDGDSYLTGDRTFLYNAENNWFRHFGISNAGNKNYSGMPVVTAPVYATGQAYGRTSAAGKFGTICLPFGSTNYTGATFYEFVGSETGKVYLGSVTTLEAGVPYIFEASATEVAVYGDGTTAATPGNSKGLHGTFTDETPVATGNYILLNNELRPSDGNAKVNANRAYIVMSEVPTGVPTQMPGRRYIGMSVQGENETTGVEDLFTTDAPVKVIENGQLIIIRDGVKYNVQGQVIR